MHSHTLEDQKSEIQNKEANNDSILQRNGILSRQPKNEKKKLLEEAKYTLSKAKDLLNDPDLNENMTFEEYLSKIETKPSRA